MLIEGAGVVAHRPTSVPFFIPNYMRKFFPIVILALLFAACNNPEPEPQFPDKGARLRGAGTEGGQSLRQLPVRA